MANNYEKFALQGAQVFLRYDQEELIRRWNLSHDDQYLYLTYLGTKVRIFRADGAVSFDPAQSSTERTLPSLEMDEAMAIYDLLCHSAHRPHASGSWESISSLGGVIGAGHDQSLNREQFAARFAGQCPKLRAVCERLGGIRQKQGDVSYAFPVFEDFCIWFQFWDADDEFPADIKYLFDGNALQFMHYESLWYVMNSVEKMISHAFSQAGS